MKNWKRLLSVLLALVLVSTMISGLALAEEKKIILKITEIKIKESFEKNLKPFTVDDSDAWVEEDVVEVTAEKEPTSHPEDEVYVEDSVVFESDKPSVFQVTPFGEYKARKEGTATITVRSDANPSVKASFKVEVKPAPVITGLSFSTTDFEIAVGEEALDIFPYAEGSFDPADTEYEDIRDSLSVSFSSSDPEVAYAYGVEDYSWGERWYIKGKKAGNATITVTLTNKNGKGKPVSASVNITVTETGLQSLSFSKSSITLNKAINSTADLYEYLVKTPVSADNQYLKWESSNEQVASVQGGFVVALRPGTAVITVYSSTNPSIKASIEIVVIEYQAITELKFDEKTVRLYFVKKDGKLNDDRNSTIVWMTVQPASATSTIKNIQWTTSKATVAIPQGYWDMEDGLKIYGVDLKAVGKGTTTITANVTDTSGNKYTASFKVKVSDKTPTAKLNKKTLKLKVGKKFTLKAKDADTKAALKGKWTSSNKKVAKVDKNGKVKAVGAGRCVITFKPKVKGMLSVTCVVIVE